MLAMSAFAQMSPTASTDVYDLSQYGEELIELFYTAEKNGRKVPTQAEFEAAGLPTVLVGSAETPGRIAGAIRGGFEKAWVFDAE